MAPPRRPSPPKTKGSGASDFKGKKQTKSRDRLRVDERSESRSPSGGRQRKDGHLRPQGERRNGPRSQGKNQELNERQNNLRPLLPQPLNIGRELSSAPPLLLAPAGSKASWAAAIEAGADAVYLGLNDFSARTYAENFSLAELAVIIKESNDLGVRVYLAFNSLIKEGELKAAWKLLATAASLEPDALILQDLGLASLAARHFPDVPRHASTLTAVHTLPGLVALQKAGFSRAVLARELALDEVAALSQHSPIDVEVFVHGALCFSFSGLCLMSSFLGGRSALRGGCTQPCRRTYQRGSQKNAFFSTTDLNVAPYLKQLRTLPITTFKIEGRMKGPDYVSRVVRAYRMLLDVPDEDWPYALVEAENIFRQVPGRQTSGGPLAVAQEGAWAPLSPSTTSGLKLGWLDSKGPGRGSIRLENSVEIGDRLRLQPKTGDESYSFKLKGISQNGEELSSGLTGAEVLLTSPQLPPQAGHLFKIASGREEKAFLASPLVKAVKEGVKVVKLPLSPPLPPELAPQKSLRPTSKKSVDSRHWWLWLERAEDLRELTGFDAHRVILPLTTPNVRHVRHHRRHFKQLAERLIWSLPPLIFHRRQQVMAGELAGLISSGFREFFLSNIGQINILQRLAPESGPALKLWGDHRLGVLNHLAEKALIEMGLAGVTFSPEADGDLAGLWWKSPPAGGRLLYLYGRPALFTARYPLDLKRLPVFSPRGEKFWVAAEGEAALLTCDRPIFMAPFLKNPPLPGGVGFIVDLRGEAHLGPKLRQLKKALLEAKLGQGSIFNFKRGLA